LRSRIVRALDRSDPEAEDATSDYVTCALQCRACGATTAATLNGNASIRSELSALSCGGCGRLGAMRLASLPTGDIFSEAVSAGDDEDLPATVRAPRPPRP
jgi:hypothetical protein